MSSADATNAKPVDYNNVAWKDLNKGRFYGLMPLGSIGIRIMVFPINVIKTRMQTLPGYTGVIQAGLHSVRSEGFRSLYRGFGTSLLGLPIGPIFVSTLEMSKETLALAWEGHKAEQPVPYTDRQDNIVKTAIPFVCSATAMITSQIVVVPVDVISQRQMVDVHTNKNDHTPHKTARSIARHVMATEGIPGFFRGYLISCMAYVPSSSLLWGNYFFLKKTARKYIPLDTGSRFSYIDILMTPACGATAASISAICTNPLDIIRTRTQVREENIGIRETVRGLLNEPKGWRGLWTGLTPRMISMSTSASVVLSIYELLKRASAH